MAANGRYVFYGWGAEGPELWTTDGSAAGTRLLTEFVTGENPQFGYPEGGAPRGFVAMPDGRILFSATDARGAALWTTDGTAAGTQRIGVPGMVPDLSDIAQYGPQLLADGRVLFRATDAAHGLELWVTDGSAAGTQLLADLQPGSGASVPESVTMLGDGRFVFSALAPDRPAGNYDRELYVSDGTAGGTRRLVDYQPGTDTPLNPQDFVAIGQGKVLFASDMPPRDASAASPGKLFWVTDGTAEGTQRIPQVTIDRSFTWPQSMLQLDEGRVVFTVSDGSGTATPWISDGTAAGTHVLADLPVITGSDHQGGLQRLSDGRLLIQARGAAGIDLWVSDGTEAGTTPLKAGLPGQQASFLQLQEGTMLLSVVAGSHTQIWRSDGTAEGTYLLEERPDLGLRTFHGAAEPVEGGGWIFGGSDSGGYGSSVWSTDGTPGGTTLLSQTQVSISTGLEPIFFEPGLAFPIQDTSGGVPHDWAAELPLFDRAFYRATYADIGPAVDPVQHFLQWGGAEGRDPNALFDTSFYLNQNPDVAAAGLGAFQHYMAQGWREARAPGLGFDGTAYLAANPDVAAAGLNPLAHYLLFGQAEGRAAIQATPHATAPQAPLVDAAYYFAANADIAREGIDPTAHYMQAGWREGRDPDALFDTDYYLTANPDVAAAGINPLQHYLDAGAREGRDPSAGFDGDAYLAANPDVAAATMNPLLHYLQSGQAEGRDIFPA